jgi:hypothetical protein
MQNKLELSTPLLGLWALTLVLVCEYFKVLTAVSLAIQMARLWSRTTAWRRRPAGRPRQLGSLLTSDVGLWTRESLLLYASAMKLWTWWMLIPRSTLCVIWDRVISICKTTMVCNEWWLMIFNCYVSQQQYSWDCDVWHDRHLDLKIRVLTSWYQSHCLTLGDPS